VLHRILAVHFTSKGSTSNHDCLKFFPFTSYCTVNYILSFNSSAKLIIVSCFWTQASAKCPKCKCRLKQQQYSGAIQRRTSRWRYGKRQRGEQRWWSLARYLEVFWDGSIGEAGVEGTHVLPQPQVHPGVVGHGGEALGNIWVRGQAHVIQWI